MESDDRRVVLGKISTVYGVKGWLKVNSFTNPRKNILNYPQWQLKTRNGWIKQAIEQGRPHGKTLVVKLAGCEDRDQAQLLTGSTVAVFRNQLPDTESGEHISYDILGTDVLNTDGQELGQVKEIMESASNDVL
ncbi:MAG: 16S rRNA processing protein RimM, partial [Gammaproteobacteria bacterium]|nr:16S rRNA processing protein RimM [Gammaproteobacteria bacterium]